MGKDRVDALTGARTFAALYLLALHFGAPLFARAPATLERLRAHGYVTTSYFLTLSGFVLTVAYGPRLHDGRTARRDFVVARVARLYPMYVLALALLVPLALVPRLGEAARAFDPAATVHYKLFTGVAHLMMSQVLLPSLVGAWNGPGWCVAVEMWFYLAFPFVCGFLLARRARTVAAVAAAAYLVSLALAGAYTFFAPDGAAATVESSGFYIMLLKYTPYARMSELVFGAAVGALYLRCPSALRGRRYAGLMVGGAAVAILVVLLGDAVPYPLLHNGGLLPLYAVLIWGLMLGGGAFGRLLSCRPLTFVGNASYALYILQVPLMAWSFVVTGGRRDDPLTVALSLAAVVAAALALHHLVEVRAQAWLKTRLLGFLRDLDHEQVKPAGGILDALMVLWPGRATRLDEDAHLLPSFLRHHLLHRGRKSGDVEGAAVVAQGNDGVVECHRN